MRRTRLAVCSNDADHFGQRIFDGAVAVDELESFTVDGSDADFESWTFGGVDYSAHLKAEHLAGEHTVFANR